MVVEPLKLQPLPTNLIERVAVDHVSSILYVDRAVASSPMLLTWVDRCRASGVKFTIKPVDVDEVAKLRSGGMRQVLGDDDDKQVRAAALAIICQSADYGASDIHLMMRGAHTEIQIVVNGELRVLTRKTHSEGEALVRAIWQGLAKTKDASYNSLEFQNAQIPGEELPPETCVTSVRIVRGPCYPQSDDGSFMTMRLQYNAIKKSKKDLPALELPRRPDGELQLVSMGYDESQVEKIRTLMAAPNGIIIYTGPTGSGKTTSMFEALQDIARSKPERRLVTIEDPVEYPMDWAVQLAVTNAKNETETGAAFGERLRVALRMAPNIILMGELRGADVAAAALEAAVTGHQVWSTMHVTDPYLFVDRLELMDRERLDRKVFCDHKMVRGVIGQRLIPKLCPDCSIPITDQLDALPARMLKALETWGDLIHTRLLGKGCASCGGSGTKGRSAVAEVVVTDAELMRDFIREGSETARDNHRQKKGTDPSMLEAAIGLALKGEVDPRKIEDYVDLIEPRDRRRHANRV